ncbi:DUF2948 family protein [Kiloniella sp. b19]|uniref:DUF2948 family protein n=1 Tax=Kiloniella sp. GXU_MW_B19 TaxID=3141326 RepID=UPI0031CEBAA4
MNDQQSMNGEVKGLKIRVGDHEDLRSMASLLQDALVPLRDVAWLPTERRFVMVVNRFCWEKLPAEIRERASTAPDQGGEDASFTDVEDLPNFYRVNTGICFDRVVGVQAKDIDLSDKDQILNLLTIASDPDSKSTVVLHFSGGGAVRLKTSGIHCHLDDISEPWPSLNQPRHDVKGSGEAEQDPASS